MKLSILLLLTLAAPALPAATPSLDAPTGVTLSVDAANAGLLSWQPIDRDDLMGYSIWMRQAKEEYTRLSIPMMIGKELKKLNMTTKNSLLLKGAGKRELEIVVIAEYEGGRSKPSASVLTKKAKREAPVAATAPDTAPDAAPDVTSPTAKPLLTTTPVPPIGGDEDDGPPQDLEANQRPQRTEMAPVGSFHTSAGIDFLYEITETRGFNSLTELGEYIVGQPLYDRVTQRKWYLSYTRRNIRIPLAVQFGLLPQLEVGADIAYVNERIYRSKFDFGSDTFEDYQGSRTMDGTGFSNPAAQVRFQPMLTVPLRAGLRVSFPTGTRSRLQAWDELWLNGIRLAGVDDGVSRLQFSLEYGDRQAKQGIFYRAMFMPAATETHKTQAYGYDWVFGTQHGQLVEGNVGYNFPWNVGEKPGSISVQVGIQSLDAGTWTISGVNLIEGLNNYDRIPFKAESGINPTREDRFEISALVSQNIFALRDGRGSLRYAVDAQGKFGFALKPDGWLFHIGGGFLY